MSIAHTKCIIQTKNVLKVHSDVPLHGENVTVAILLSACGDMHNTINHMIQKSFGAIVVCCDYSFRFSQEGIAL